MHQLPVQLHLFLIFLASTSTTFTMLQPHKKTSENQYNIPTFLHQRLHTIPLLLEGPPFNLQELPSELQTRIASFVTPHAMSNISVTCKSLHEKLTFQTPGIWDIVTHSIHAISNKKLPELLLKAHYCEQDATEEEIKLFYVHIKEKILSCYDVKAAQPYYYVHRADKEEWHFSFNPFAPDCSKQLLGACYTGDKNIVHTMLKKYDTLSREYRDSLLMVTIIREKINIIQLLCQSDAAYLERLLQQCLSYTTYKNPAHTLNWNDFIANKALYNNKKKSFESIVMYYKQYLNIVDKNGMKYLDYIVHKCGNKKNYGEYPTIVMKNGGTGNEETIKMIDKKK